MKKATKKLKISTLINIILIIINIILILLIIMALAYAIAKTTTQKAETADEKISEFIQSDIYINSSFQDRKELASQFIDNMKHDGYIHNVYYDDTTGLFSFQYADGSLGGIQTKDFTTKVDGLPMN